MSDKIIIYLNCLRILLSFIFRSEANDLALRIARQHTDAEDMIIVDR